MAPRMRWLSEQKRFDGDPLGTEVRAPFLRALQSTPRRTTNNYITKKKTPTTTTPQKDPNRLTKNATTWIDLTKEGLAATPTTPQSRDQDTTTASTSMQEPKGSWFHKLGVKENDRHLPKKKVASA